MLKGFHAPLVVDMRTSAVTDEMRARGAVRGSAGLKLMTQRYCASHKNWTSVHQLPLQNHCFIGSGGGS